jgi:hypothetical protein
MCARTGLWEPQGGNALGPPGPGRAEIQPLAASVTITAIRNVLELLGHKDVRTTMIHTHVLNRGGRGVRSPANGLVRRLDER